MTGRVGIVVCSRTDSARLPQKPFQKVRGKYLLAHLLDRLIATGLPVYLAVPEREVGRYTRRLEPYLAQRRVIIFGGDKNDPLKRTHDVARHYDTERYHLKGIGM